MNAAYIKTLNQLIINKRYSIEITPYSLILTILEDGNDVFFIHGGYWERNWYDDKGNLILCKNSDGMSRKYKRDACGNILEYSTEDGYVAKYTYDSNGNELTFDDNAGRWARSTYDSNGREISYVSSEKP